MTTVMASGLLHRYDNCNTKSLKSIINTCNCYGIYTVSLADLLPCGEYRFSILVKQFTSCLLTKINQHLPPTIVVVVVVVYIIMSVIMYTIIIIIIIMSVQKTTCKQIKQVTCG